MKYAQTRHAALQLVASDQMVRTVTQRFVRLGGILSGPLVRTLRELGKQGLISERLMMRYAQDRPVRLASKGAELLAAWDAEFGKIEGV